VGIFTPDNKQKMAIFEEDIKNCIEVLEKGGTIVYPTDTIWGIGCDALNGNAVDKVFALKQRPKEKSMIVLLAEARDILQYIAAPPPDIIHILEEFTAPTTVIYKGALGFPASVTGADDSIAIRIVDEPFCKALIKRFRKPIISTSANLSGKPSPATYSMIEPGITEGCDYVVKYRQDDHTIRSASRILRLDDEGNFEILR
jgi:L-threonylcarbamoyladenylate synthase